MQKKVLGLSFGRKLGNSEVMVKQALLECEKAGYGIKFIRVMDLNILPCTGCTACVAGMASGRGVGKCVLKDDFHILDEAIMECDALIVCTPTYECGPSGLYRTVCDRIGPSHDVSFRKTAFEDGIAKGKSIEELPDERSLKKRVGALLTVGGARTANWLSFTIPTMYAMTLSLGIDVIDTYRYVGAMSTQHVTGRPDILDRMTQVGRHISEALASQNEEQRLSWRGDDEGTCPVCHCDLISIMHDGMHVECPVCGIRGELKSDNGKISVEFSEAEQKRSRLFYAGKLEHSNEIKDGIMTEIKVDNLKEKKEKYLHIGE